MDIDLENGGGGGVSNNDDIHDAAVFSTSFPNPADPRTKEKQPFTWPRAAPFIVAVLAGVALFAVGVAVMASPSCSTTAGADDEKRPASDTTGGCDELGYVLALGGALTVITAAYAASTVLICECCCCAPRRLDQADD